MRKMLHNIDSKALSILVVIMLVIGALWSTPFVYPLKILVVFFHELSHALTAVATGGQVVEIQINAMQGGLAITRGGSSFWVTFSGYVGSLVWGGGILFLAARTRLDRLVAVTLGAVVIAVTALFVRPFFSFGFLFGVLAGAGFVISGRMLPGVFNDFLLRVVGLTSMMYAILDIKSDVFDRPELPSDAVILAEMTHVPALFWGILWSLISLLAASGFLITACQKPRPNASPSTRNAAGRF